MYLPWRGSHLTIYDQNRHQHGTTRGSNEGKSTNLVGGLEAREGELGGRVGLVGRLGGGDDGRVGREGEVNPGERNQLQSNPAYQSRTLSAKEVEDARWSGTRSSRR